MELVHTYTHFSTLGLDRSDRHDYVLAAKDVDTIEIKIFKDELGYYHYTYCMAYTNKYDGGGGRYSIGFGRNYFEDAEFTNHDGRADQVERSTGLTYESVEQLIRSARDEWDKETLDEVANPYDSVTYDEDDGWVLKPHLLTYGDYVGSMVEKTNNQVFWDEFGDRAGVSNEYEGFHSYAIALTADAIRDNEDIVETLNALADYPLLDEEKHSELCMDEYQESWENYGQSDFIDEICRKLTPHHYDFDDFLDEAGSDKLMTLYESGIPSGEYYIEETGGIALNVDTSVDNLTLEDLAQWVKEVKKEWKAS